MISMPGHQMFEIPGPRPQVAENLSELVDHDVVGAQCGFLLVVDHVLL